MNKIYGYDSQKTYVLKAIKNNSISHFYIIYGEEGCGKKTFVNYFAKAIMCDKNEPCGKCIKCEKIDNKNSVDVRFVKSTNKNSIGTRDIKDLTDDLYVRPMENDYKIYIITDGEKLTLEASNTLLKALEEPPEYAIFFLITSNKENVIDTILSRGTQIYLPPLSDEIVKKYIYEQMKVFDEQKVDFLVNYSFGNIGTVKKILSNDSFFNIRGQVIDIVMAASNNDGKCLNMIKNLFEQNKEYTDEIINIIFSIARDIVVCKAIKSSGKIINSDKVNDITKISKNLKDCITFYDNLIEVKKLKDRNVNVSMALKTAFLNVLSEE